MRRTWLQYYAEIRHRRVICTSLFQHFGWWKKFTPTSIEIYHLWCLEPLLLERKFNPKLNRLKYTFPLFIQFSVTPKQLKMHLISKQKVYWTINNTEKVLFLLQRLPDCLNRGLIEDNINLDCYNNIFISVTLLAMFSFDTKSMNEFFFWWNIILQLNFIISPFHN